MKTINVHCRSCNKKFSVYGESKGGMFMKFVDRSHIRHDCKPRERKEQK